MSNFLTAFLKATGRAGLDNDQIMQIAKSKYANIDLRLDPQFTQRETFQINDEITAQTKAAMDEFGHHNIPPEVKAKLEDFAAKAIAFGDDQQTLRHTNAFLKFSDDIFGPGGSSNVTSMVPDQLARQAHKNSIQAADSTYGDFPGREGMIKANIQRMTKEAPGEVEVLRNYLNSGYDGTYAEYLRSEVDSEKWMHYMNPFPEGYGSGDFAAGGRVGAAGGGLMKELLKKLLGGAKGKGVGSLMKPKAGIVPEGMMQEAGVHQKMMQEPGWYRDRILGESKLDEAVINLGEATKHRTGWQPDPLNPVVAKRHREAFALPKEEEGIMQVSKIDDEVHEMLTEMRSMKDKSKTMLAEADYKVIEMKAKEKLVDDMVVEMDEGVHPRIAVQRFINAYNKLVRPQHATGGRVGLGWGGLLSGIFGGDDQAPVESVYSDQVQNKINLLETAEEAGFISAEDQEWLDEQRESKATGGRVGMWGGGLLKKMMGTALNPKREKQLLDTKLNLGQNPAAIGDMEQLKNIIRNPETDLPAIHELEDMIQNSTRYSDEQKELFQQLIRKEKIRADVLYDNPKAQKMAEQDPEGFDAILEQMMKEGGGDFATGGRVGLHEGGVLGSMGVADGSYQQAQQAAQPIPADTPVPQSGLSSPKMMYHLQKNYATTNPEGFDQNPIAPQLRNLFQGTQNQKNPIAPRLRNLPSYFQGTQHQTGSVANRTLTPKQEAGPAPYRPMSGPGSGMPGFPWSQPESNSFTGGTDLPTAVHTLSEEHNNLGREIQQIGQQPLSQQSQQQNSISPNNPHQNVLSGFGGGIGNLFGARS